MKKKNIIDNTMGKMGILIMSKKKAKGIFGSHLLFHKTSWSDIIDRLYSEGYGIIKINTEGKNESI